jgi:hypothetical protein
MKRMKLDFRFHNPNTTEETIDYMLKILVDVNKRKVEEILRKKAMDITDKKVGLEI